MNTTQDERDELRKAAEQWQGKTLYSDVPHELLLRLLDDAEGIEAKADPHCDGCVSAECSEETDPAAFIRKNNQHPDGVHWFCWEGEAQP